MLAPMLSDAFWPGIVAIAILYVAVFAVGVVATRRAPASNAADGDAALVELLLAGRSLPTWVGLLTMTATWVGGGYINGTAERAYTSGVLWGGQAGIGYALSLIVGGLVFAVPMRRLGYSTLVDPFEDRYGRGIAALLMVPAVLAELIWSAAILVALGSTFGTVVGLPLVPSILVSAAVAIAYTVFGGLRAVAWTDVVQLLLIAAGLVVAAPFVVDAAGGFRVITEAFAAASFASPRDAISWSDYIVLLILGGIPWNVYFQRVLAARTPAAARTTSYAAGALCAAMALPPLMLGLAGARIDWATLPTGGVDVAATIAETPSMVLPLLLRYAVPTWIGVIGLGAVSAAVMSSVDSSILSAAALVAWNGYRRLWNPAATAAEVQRLVKGLIVVLGAAATLIGLSYGSVAALWYLCGDIVYCVLFPQLTLALFDPRANRAGALAGLSASVLLRFAGGDRTLGLPNLLFPDWSADGVEFPFRTLAMCAGLLVTAAVSRLTSAYDPPRALRAPPVG